MRGDVDLDDARKRFRYALAPEDRDRLPFYSALLDRLEENELALEMLAGVRTEQRNPMLVLAALHLAALRGHPRLEPIYDAARRGRLRDPIEAASSVDQVVRDEPDLVRREMGRSTQTNEPGRSAVLQAVIRDVAAGRDVIGLLDVGTSAGINLHFDCFSVRARGDGDPLTLVCRDDGAVDRQTPLPAVVARVGIDPHPLDLARDEDRQWLKACLWPEERQRHDRFDAVVAHRPAWPATTVLEGSVLDRLDEGVALASPGVLGVVVNTWSAFYFSPHELSEYYQRVRSLAERRRVAWVSIESTLVAWPDLDAAGSSHPRGASQIVVARPGEAPERWGWCHAHGRWVERLSRA